MKKTIVVVSLALAAGLAAAQTSVKNAWVRGTVPQQQVTGLFAQLVSADGARLVGASSPAAASVELHEMAMVGDVMKMRELTDGLALPAGQVVELKPGGNHIMLMGLKQPLKAGDSVPLTLIIERSGKPRETLQLLAPVRALGQ